MNIDAFFKITYGFYVVSSSDGVHESGFISNTVMQVTAEPVQLLITSNKQNYTTALIQKSKVFAISALRQDTKLDIISKFGYKSGRDIDKFASFGHIRGVKNIPILTEDCIAWFECEVFQEIDVGTHILFLARVKNSELLDASCIPLTYAYYREVLKMKSPKNAPTYINPEIIKKSEVMKEETKQNDIYVCEVCGYEYDPAKGDPDSGIAPGTAFEDIPDDWVCPLCGVDKSNFTKK